MAEVWGNLAKAQDDNQTINEAIAEAIAEHESDSSAHLGSGESLEAHKSSEVIDHLAGSIVSDKNTMLELVYETEFESLEKWIVNGSVDNTIMPGCRLGVVYGDYEEASIEPYYDIFDDRITFTKHFLLDIILSCDIAGTTEAFIGICSSVQLTPTKGFGFKLVDDALYGFVNFDGTPHSVDLDYDVLYAVQHLRAEFDPVTSLIKWYVNGVQKGSYTVGTPSISYSSFLGAIFKITAGSEAYLTLRRIKVVRDV